MYSEFPCLHPEIQIHTNIQVTEPTQHVLHVLHGRSREGLVWDKGGLNKSPQTQTQWHQSLTVQHVLLMSECATALIYLLLLKETWRGHLWNQHRVKPSECLWVFTVKFNPVKQHMNMTVQTTRSTCTSHIHNSRWPQCAVCRENYWTSDVSKPTWSINE